MKKWAPIFRKQIKSHALWCWERNLTGLCELFDIPNQLVEIDCNHDVNKNLGLTFTFSSLTFYWDRSLTFMWISDLSISTRKKRVDLEREAKKKIHFKAAASKRIAIVSC